MKVLDALREQYADTWMAGKVLPDGRYAILIRQIANWAIVVGRDEWTYEARY